MAVEVKGIGHGITVAAADLSAEQYKAVKVTAAMSVNLATVAGEPIIGILQNKPTVGQPADIMVVGVSKVRSGAAIAAGALLMAGSDGRIITAASAGSEVIGVALEAATAADQYITAHINIHGGIV